MIYWEEIMKIVFKKIIALMMVFTIILTNLAYADGETATNNEVDNVSAAMINYLSMKTYEAIECDYNIYDLQNITEEIRGKIKRDAIKNDKETETYVFNTLLNKLTDLKISSNAYNRIKEVLSNAKSKALREAAMEAAKGVKDVGGKDGPVGWVAKALGTAGMSALTYQKVMSEAKEGYDEEKFTLDQEQIKVVDGLKNDLLHYNFDLGDGKNIDDKLLLREDDIKKYLDIKNYSTVDLRIHDFEKNQERFGKFPNYWLDLCANYFLRGKELDSNADYKKCIEALKKYEENGGIIFREGKDTDFHERIPDVIASAKNLYNKNEYVKFAEEYLKKMDGDLSWELAYYKAETYKDLYNQTSNKEYIRKAYEVINDNMTALVNEQDRANEANDKKVKEALEEAKKNGSTGIYLNEVYYHPVSDALLFYLDDLFECADILNISESEKKAIDRKLHKNNERLFKVYPIDNKYWFYMPENIKKENEELKQMFTIEYLTGASDKYGLAGVDLIVTDNLICKDGSMELINMQNGNAFNTKSIGAAYVPDTQKGYHFSCINYYGKVKDSAVGNVYEVQITPKVGCDYGTYTAKYRLCKNKTGVDSETGIKAVIGGYLAGPIGALAGVIMDQDKKNKDNYYFELVEEE